MTTAFALRHEDRFAQVQAVNAWKTRPTAQPPARQAASVQPVLNFAQDTGIFAEGDEAVSFYKVVSGVVRSCKFQNDGRRHIDAFYMPGDVFGFEVGPEHELSAEAVTDCAVTAYPRRALEARAGGDGAAALQLYTFAMRSLARARAHSQLLGRASAAHKLAAFLLEVSAGKPAEAIDLVMTRQDIADYLGLTIETVSRTLSLLEREGVIRLAAARRILVADRAHLQSLCD
jgi:CRP/FNR family nitrogen fixation transcriptional regulator